jgi:hypothetical protein
MGDKFIFKAENHGSANLMYTWEIIDTENDATLIKKT